MIDCAHAPCVHHAASVAFGEAIEHRVSPQQRVDAQLSLGSRACAAAHFSIACAVATRLLWLRSKHSLTVKFAAASWLIVSIAAIGMILDDAPRARTYESLRIVASFVALGCVFFWP